jgi:hypothetical protein
MLGLVRLVPGMTGQFWCLVGSAIRPMAGWGMRTRSRGQGRTAGVGSVKGPSRGAEQRARRADSGPSRSRHRTGRFDPTATLAARFRGVRYPDPTADLWTLSVLAKEIGPSLTHRGHRRLAPSERRGFLAGERQTALTAADLVRDRPQFSNTPHTPIIADYRRRDLAA